MRPGKKYRLKEDVAAIEVVASGKHFACSVFKDSEIEVIGGPHADGRMFDVQWGARKLIMFADDITLKGKEIQAEPEGLSRRGPASEERTAQKPELPARKAGG